MLQTSPALNLTLPLFLSVNLLSFNKWTVRPVSRSRTTDTHDYYIRSLSLSRLIMLRSLITDPIIFLQWHGRHTSSRPLNSPTHTLKFPLALLWHRHLSVIHNSLFSNGLGNITYRTTVRVSPNWETSSPNLSHTQKRTAGHYAFGTELMEVVVIRSYLRKHISQIH